MKSHVTFRASLAAILIVAVTGIASSPIQLQNGANTLQREDYAPIMAEYLTRYLEDRSNQEPRNLDSIGGGHLLKQARRGMDAFSGTAFGENKRFVPFRRSTSTNTRPGNFDEIDRTVFDRFTKRNIDEIDSAFDSFYKRNLDEIDRVGWSGFVKRLDNYLNRQH